MPYSRQILLLLFLCFWSVHISAQEPTLARIVFRLPPEQKPVFEKFYQEKLQPILTQHGLKESSVHRHSPPDSLVVKVYELATPTEVTQKSQALGNDNQWQHAIQYAQKQFGKTLLIYTSKSGQLKIYRTPAGPGTVVPVQKEEKSMGQGRGHWSKFETTDGLIDNVINNTFKDRDGNIWFTTQNGVSRYDGYSWSSISTKQGLAHNYVYDMTQDKKGRYWFVNKALNIYDGKHVSQMDLPEGLEFPVFSATCDQAGNLWFGSRSGVGLYNGQNWQIFSSQHGFVDPIVYKVFQDHNGIMWFGTANGLSRYDGKNFTHFNSENGYSFLNIDCIIQDQEGDIWFGTRNGVKKYDGVKFTDFAPIEALNNTFIWDIFEDHNNNIWFSTGQNLIRYDRKKCTVFSREDYAPNSLFTAISQDNDGHIWLGTINSVLRYDENIWTTYTTDDGLPSNAVVAIVNDAKTGLWFLTNDGKLNFYDGQTLTTYSGISPSGRTTNLIQDQHGNIWFASAGGVSKFDGENFTTFTRENGLPHNLVMSVLEDKDGNIWFGTWRGAVCYDGKTFTTFSEADGLPHQYIFSILQDRTGNIWFATPGSGVSKYNGTKFDNFSTKHGLASDAVNPTAIYEDREGNIWFGTRQGVSRYDGSQFQTFTVHDGLTANRIVEIYEDKKGHLWFGTHGSGISSYDGQTFQTIRREDGLSDNNVNAMVQDANQSYWFGTSNGLTKYHPSISSLPSVEIASIWANRLHRDTSELKLPSTSGSVAFEFIAKSFRTRPSMMVYRYRLKGYDADWQNTRKQRIEYEDLPIGTYTFEVLAVDRDLIYSAKPATVNLIVHLPYERISWISALSIAILAIVWQTTRVILRDRRLRESNAALSTANQKIQEQTQRKSAFLSQMSHEIRTPITSIKGYVDNMLDGIGGTLNERQARNLTRVSQNSDHLLGLVNSLLDLSKIEAGRMDVDVSTFDIAELISTCCDTVQPLVKPNVELRHNITDNLGHAQTDQSRVRQILINLLSNALKFTEEGHVEIRAKKEPVNTLCISVSDTGTGIPPEDLQTIFEDFKQVKGSDTQHKGTGLGLPITKGFVELLGGNIEVKSDLDKGSTFTIQIPLEYQK